MNTRPLLTLTLLLVASIAFAADAQLVTVFTDSETKSLPMDDGGTLFVDSPVGSVEVVGTDDHEVEIEVTRTIRAPRGFDFQKVRDGLDVAFGGTEQTRRIRSVGVATTRQLVAAIDYRIKVPKLASVNVIGQIGEKFSVEGVDGRVFVRNFRGKVELKDLGGTVQVDSINADVQLTYTRPPSFGARIESLNGKIEVRVPSDASVNWIAQTLKGDIMSGGFSGLVGQFLDNRGQKTYNAVLNEKEGPTITTTSVTGIAYLLPTDKPRTLAASLVPTAPPGRELEAVAVVDILDVLPVPPRRQPYPIQHARVPGNFDLQVGLGSNVMLGQVDGTANVHLTGGELVIARVGRNCHVRSQGGGVILGDVIGGIDVTTAVGDIDVNAARKGGRAETGGGNVTVLYSGSNLVMASGGGNLTVRQAMGGVTADTKSGDVSVTLDPRSRSRSPIRLTTTKGNILLEISPERGLDVQAVIETNAASAKRIESEFSGLSTSRETRGNRVVIRANGKLNGGGTEVVLKVVDGSIDIRRIPENRIVLANP